MEVEWINRALGGATSAQQVEERLRHILDEKQDSFKDSNAGIRELALVISRSLPFARLQLESLTRDALQLQRSLASLDGRVSDLEGAVSDSVALLAQIDAAKQKMERCIGALCSAEALIVGLESFCAPDASGQSVADELRRAAATSFAPSAAQLVQHAAKLAQLKRQFAALHDMPIFRRRRDDVAALESNLLQLAARLLATALEQQDVVAARDCVAVFSQLDSMAIYQDIFTRSSAQRLRQLWCRHFPSTAAPSTTNTRRDAADALLGGFYAQCLSLLRDVNEQCRDVAGPDSGSYVAHAVRAAFEELSPDVQRFLADRPLHDVLAMHARTLGFVASLKSDVLADQSPSLWEDAVLGCYASLQQNYCTLERQLLDAAVASLLHKPRSLADVVPAFARANEPLFAALREAFARWLAFTNAAAPARFVELVSAVLLAYLDHVAALCDFARSEAQLDVPAEQPGSNKHFAYDWRHFDAALQLQKASKQFAALLADYDYALSDQLQRDTSVRSSSSSSSSDKVLQPVFDAQHAIASTLGTLAFDTMFSFIKYQLSALPALSDVWYGAAAAVADERLQSPSLYLVEIKEHIYALPERLEPFAVEQASSASDDPSRFIEQWVSIISRATMTLYEQRIRELDFDRLSPDGAKQLVFDIQHLNYVLSAVKVELSEGLRAILARTDRKIQALSSTD